MISGRDDLRKAYQDDDVAREYVGQRFTTPLGALLHARQTDVVKQLIATNSIRRAIEIAPGPARVTVAVAPLVEYVTLVDTSLQMLSEARRRLTSRVSPGRARFVQGDAFRLPLHSRVDLVYAFRLIRHFAREDRHRLYGQIAGLLSPGGFLVFDAVNALVSGPLRAKAPDDCKHFDALLSPGEILAELREAGFGDVSLVGVQHRYNLLAMCQVYVAPRSTLLARAMMEVIDRLGGEPLEWVVVCRRK